MQFEVCKFKSVTSTNDVAINLIKDKKEESGCVCADRQTKGRGTHGKQWISDEGNLFVTMFFPLRKNYPPFNEFSIINPIIISEVIKHFCKGKNITLKFPNDVFVNGKKICGILQELITLNGRKFLIVGIGMNIVTNPDINKKYQATNISIETKQKSEIKEIISLIISSYEQFFIDLNSYNYVDFKQKADLMASN